INNALQQLNNVTQQNAAASEELATNAEEMTAQAEMLREKVSYFKTGEEHAAMFKTSSGNNKASLLAGHKKKQPSAQKPHGQKGININLTGASNDENYTNL
ncbi:MAG: methyl-accepting chemotaxis protein, partial [Chloroflexia bacterium]|nr:methyl-accepting chemotaxis protein [Chloroflexia bacterium]